MRPQLLFIVLITLVLAHPAAAQNPEQPPPLRFQVKTFRVTGDNPLSPERTGEVLSGYLGEYSGIEPLLEAARSLEQALAEAGHSFHRVVLPPQTLKQGKVVLEVVAFKVGTVTVEGNEHFSDENILASLPALVSGEAPRTQDLSNQRHLANQHPSKVVEVRFKESETTQAVDAIVSVQDSGPEGLFLDFNNTGSDETGYLRLTGGFQHSNLSDNDDQITFTYTVSPTDIEKVQQYGGVYALPLHSLGGIWSMYGTKSDVDSGVVAGIDISGAGHFIGTSYRHFLPRSGPYTHSVQVGLEDRRFDSDVIDLSGLGLGDLSTPTVRSRPITASYQGDYEALRWSGGFYFSYTRNITSGDHNDKRAYRGNRFRADPEWDAVRLGAQGDFALQNGWLLRARADAQFTDEPLIPGEQIGIGGARSVRGYREREFAGDMGAFGSVEAWTPGLFQVAGAEVRLIGFLDLGYRKNKKEALIAQTTSLVDESNTARSVGLGLRWFWQTNLSVEADLARTLDPGIDHGTGHYRAHFNIFMRM